MFTGTTLYYPYIHPRHADALKASLIYWDRIRRIVPDSVADGIYADDDDQDTKMLADHGLLISTSPAQYASAAAELFFEHLEGKENRFQIKIGEAKKMAARNRGMHMEKLSGEVLHKLHQRGMAQQFGDWVYMRNEIGAFYMHCLASEMSAKMKAPLMTDSKDEAAVGEAILFQPNTDDKVTSTLAQLGIQLPTPNQLSHIPMATIISFAERRAPERQAFRQLAETLLEKVASHDMQDENALNDYILSQQVQIRDTMQNLQKTLDELKVGALSAGAKIAVPTGFTTAVAALPFSPTASAILSAVGLSWAVISCVAETRGKLRQARTSSPYHYLISLKNEIRHSNANS